MLIIVIIVNDYRSPYITSIGATQLYDKYLPVCGESYAVSTAYPNLPKDDQLLFQCTGVQETTCSASIGGVITVGGGFSSVSDRKLYAPWQDKVVSKYLTMTDKIPPLSYFSSNGRGYPDISTYGSNYFVYLGGRITRESGTSASAPVFAAMVTLWNDIRLGIQKSPMGFIAPFLYTIYESNPEAFQDITTGDNSCGVNGATCCLNGFNAAPGWDAATVSF